MRLTALERVLVVVSAVALCAIAFRASGQWWVSLANGAVSSYCRFATFSEQASPGSNEGVEASRVLSRHLRASVVRVGVSAIVGTIVAFGIGLLAFRRLRPSAVADVFFAMTRGVPLMALIPVFFLAFGTRGDMGTSLYIAVATTLTLSPEVYVAATTLPLSIVKRARLSGLSEKRLLWSVVLPGVVTRLRAGFRSVVGLLWAFSIGGEMVANRDGLGYLLRRCYEFGGVGQLLLLALIYSLLGFVTIILVDALLRLALGSRG
jgi:sulfonate transport system permease protein